MNRITARLLPLLFLAGCARPPERAAARESALEDGTIEPEVGAFVAYDTPTVRAPVWPRDDQDGDGFVSAEDRDDADPLARPASAEIPCNAVAEDLDGEDLCPADSDGDGVGVDLDCDDRDPSVGPLAREIACDGLDQNCDGHDDCDADGDGVVDWDDADPRDPSIPDRGRVVGADRARPGW